ncbi:hypothetical protein CFSAN002367_01557 [Clostridium botulinum CFSAN002367]|nr:hypothetical protein CFSAN002369_09755 [Clostridium botulinum CFSAN002369]EPS52003.1 hypothetical protein CFSAN002367_01557 [Clostridium botulinum CFSAN002367]
MQKIALENNIPIKEVYEAVNERKE